ncbi:KDO2-lipid IV(A) lauroyltransferase [Cognatiyoonia sediminum]|uniref:KDO2-lipid IV(A) lauroyltransferase n=1 Tax=Cognatiyoonia sediminum TaxID=1508389 RepID=A0A1M5MPX7_9RHOB|nr:lauroyl acyltransferase [Cognatiyoonia sediminum]SHG79122.1 KDO2-lipid IV(A) lauroyltransferase [Cognatiyoonia sediminum]
MTKTPPLQGTKADWLADRALRGLIASVMQLPYQSRVPMMGSALRRAIGPLVGYRKRAEENLAFIYPDMSPTRRRQIAEGVCDNFGRTLIENYSHEEFGDWIKDCEATGAGIAALEYARAKKQPVIFVTGHYGNHEAPRQVLTRMGYEIGGLYRPMANPYFNEHYSKTMTSWGGPVFEQGKRGTMGFSKHLKSGGMGTLLFDVNYDRGELLPFLGKPARTAFSAAEIALRFDALVIPYFGKRLDDGLSFSVDLDAPIKHTDPVQMMTDISSSLEKRIEDAPEQWFWIHRRWKNKSGKSAELSGT